MYALTALCTRLLEAGKQEALKKGGDIGLVGNSLPK
tara:strand:+ start:380 stop:487 length:108 start_codon:yes stop_codon:yes gene_type:complete